MNKIMKLDGVISDNTPPDTVFVNGIYLGYSELKSNYTSQNASKNGRGKVIKDYFEAVRAYHQYIDSNVMLGDKEKENVRRDLLKIFEKAKKEDQAIANAYLKASWQVEDNPDKCTHCLEKSLERLDRYLIYPGTQNEEWPTLQVLAGELERRLSEVVRAMLQLAELRPGEILYDLGCGDGRIVLMAVQEFGAKAVDADAAAQQQGGKDEQVFQTMPDSSGAAKCSLVLRKAS
jgi:hypothetical protein